MLSPGPTPRDPSVGASRPAHGEVEAELTYLSHADVKPVTYYTADNDLPRRVGPYHRFRVMIKGGRDIATELSVDRQGFALLRSPSVVRDFYDDDEVRTVYYSETEALVRSVTGAKRALVFDHTIRVDRGPDSSDTGLRAPVQLVHNDYTERSGPQRVRDLLAPIEARQWLRGRVAEINTWRPIVGPVVSMPLALCDAASLAPEDLVSADLVYPDRTGEIYHAVHSPRHRWYYFPRMQRKELLMFKCFDSAKDGRARFTLHTAFVDPTSPPDAAARESIEVRVLLSF